MNKNILYFPHVPKAGGTTLLKLILKNVERTKILCVYNISDYKDLDPKDFYQLSKEEIYKYDVICGHLTVQEFLSNSYAKNLFEEGRIKTITSVRDPVDRLISLRNFLITHPKNPAHEATKKMDVIDFLYKQRPNLQYEYLRPKNNIDFFFNSNISMFPMKKSISLMEQELVDMFQIENIKTVNIANKTPLKIQDSNLSILKKQSLSDDVINRLYEIHHLDKRIFEESMQKW